MPQLTARNLQLGYLNHLVIEDVSLRFPAGKITALVGVNGSGKSTILKALARLLKPQRGDVLLDGQSIYDVPTKMLARQLTLLTQSPRAPAHLSVYDLVSYGRFPFRKGLSALRAADHQAIARALSLTHLEALAQREVATLSGGQRQRAWVAMALAQETPLLLLDEPTTHLDMGHGLELLELLKSLNQTQGRTIIMVLHDLNNASRYAHHMVALASGKVAAEGTPKEVMTRANLRRIFQVEADMIQDPQSGATLCIAQRYIGEAKAEGAHKA